MPKRLLTLLTAVVCAVAVLSDEAASETGCADAFVVQENLKLWFGRHVRPADPLNGDITQGILQYLDPKMDGVERIVTFADPRRRQAIMVPFDANGCAFQRIFEFPVKHYETMKRRVAKSLAASEI